MELSEPLIKYMGRAKELQAQLGAAGHVEGELMTLSSKMSKCTGGSSAHGKHAVECWSCGKEGNVRRDCPKRGERRRGSGGVKTYTAIAL